MNFLDPRLPGRFWSKCIPEPNSGCWLWLGHTANGYGRCSMNGAQLYAHRIVMDVVHGPCDVGLHTDHLCRNTLCCNPAHLERVTHAENLRRGIVCNGNSRKTHCPRGHALTGDNLYVCRRGFRSCKVCSRARVRAWRASKRS